MGCVGAMAISSHALASPDEHLVPGPGALPYGSYSQSSLLSGIQIDSYTFFANAGDHARAVIVSAGGLDATLTLLSPAPGNPILNTASCTDFNCSAVLDQLIPITGTYTLAVSDLTQRQAGAYSLHLDQYPPVNNWKGFGYTADVNNTVDHPGDSDFFGFNGASNTTVNVSAHAKEGLDPHLEIWDPDGILIANENCTDFACTASSGNLPLTKSGVYKVGVSDLTFRQIGDYGLRANCVAGVCPATIPVPIPEPSTYALMFGGLALVALLIRGRSKSTVV